MRSAGNRDRGDLTAKAVIRDEALRLFAEHGPDRVSVRQVAAAAGVSPGLVMHHYGSRQGLREAVDTHVGGVFDTWFAQAAEIDWSADTASVTELLTAALPPDSPIPGYVKQLLTGGDPAGRALFAQWYRATVVMLDRLTEAGAVRPVDDGRTLAAFLVLNDLAVLLLRDHVTATLGEDPLSREGAARWTATALAVYRDGVFTDPGRGSPGGESPGTTGAPGAAAPTRRPGETEGSP